MLLVQLLIALRVLIAARAQVVMQVIMFLPIVVLLVTMQNVLSVLMLRHAQVVRQIIMWFQMHVLRAQTYIHNALRAQVQANAQAVTQVFLFLPILVLIARP